MADASDLPAMAKPPPDERLVERADSFTEEELNALCEAAHFGDEETG